MKKGMGDILAGFTGGLVFLVFFLMLRFSVILALAIAVVAYFAVALLLGPVRKGLSLDILDEVDGELVSKAIAEAQTKIREIGDCGKKINLLPVREKIDALCGLADQIIDTVRKNPQSMKLARKFLSYYLDATVKIVRRYTELTAVQVRTPEIEESLHKVEDMLDIIKNTFEKQLGKLLEDDILDLDTEISVLEKTIKSEGL